MTGGKTKKDKRDWNAFTYMTRYIFYIDYMKRRDKTLRLWSHNEIVQFNINQEKGKGLQDSGLPTMGNTKQ